MVANTWFPVIHAEHKIEKKALLLVKCTSLYAHLWLQSPNTGSVA